MGEEEGMEEEQLFQVAVFTPIMLMQHAGACVSLADGSMSLKQGPLGQSQGLGRT